MPKYAVSFTYSRTVCFEYGIEIEAASDSPEDIGEAIFELSPDDLKANQDGDEYIDESATPLLSIGGVELVEDEEDAQR
jgi:hypothetical protein